MGLCKDGYWRESEMYEGKQYIASAKGKTPEESRKLAMKKLTQKIADAKNGMTLLNNNTTVRKWADTWLETYVKPTDITAKSYLNIKGKIDRNVVDAIGAMKLKDVKDTHLQKLLNAQAGKSMSHVTKLREYMRRMFGRAVKSKLIPYNPAEDLELPKAADKKRRPLTPAERAAFLKTAETHPAGLWIKTMLYCGLRPGETIPLQWKDIDFKAKTIHIYKALESGTKDTIKAPKSEAGFRVVPIPDDLIIDFKLKRGKPLDYIFTQVRTANKGKHHTDNSLRCYWKSFLRAVDIELGAKVERNQIVESKLSPDLIPYMLRHTYGTDLQAAGVPINVAKYLLGHEDITTTANIYTHENDDLVQQAAALINKHHIKNNIKTANDETAQS